MQAISDDVMGPYVSQGDCYTSNQEGNNMGHNMTALVAPTGTAPYTLSVGEIVAGQMFSASSANGPWTLLGLMQTNTNGHSGCGTLSSNFTFTVGPDNRFWATSRSGCIMDSDQVLGPYKVETDSVLPNLENNDNGNAEDEVIWYSGGYFHIVYNYWNVQRGYHIMSKDGVDELDEHGPRLPGDSNAGQRELEVAPLHRRHRQPMAQHGAGERLSRERPRHPLHLCRDRRGQEHQRGQHGRQQDPGRPVQRRAVRLRQRRRRLLRRSGRGPWRRRRGGWSRRNGGRRRRWARRNGWSAGSGRRGRTRRSGGMGGDGRGSGGGTDIGGRGGQPGTGGTVGTGGTAGNASGTGGTAGASSGAAGHSPSGTAGAGNGGSTGPGGSAGHVADDSGCSCDTSSFGAAVGTRARLFAAGLWLLAALVSARRRRSRRRIIHCPDRDA